MPQLSENHHNCQNNCQKITTIIATLSENKYQKITPFLENNYLSETCHNYQKIITIAKILPHCYEIFHNYLPENLPHLLGNLSKLPETRHNYRKIATFLEFCLQLAARNYNNYRKITTFLENRLQ